MNKHIPIILLLIVFLVFSACKPAQQMELIAPEEDAAQNANGDYNDAAIPNKIDDIFSSEKLNIRFQASVEATTALKYPIPKICGKVFTQEDITEIISSLFGDKPLKSLITPMSRKEYEEYYLRLLQDLEDRQNNPQDYGGNPNIKEMEAMISRVKEKMLTALEEVSGEVDPVQLYETSYGYALNTAADLGRNEPAILSVSIYPDQYECFLTFKNGPNYFNVSMTYHELIHSKPKGVHITKEEALLLANETIHAIGADDMSASGYTVGVVPKQGLADQLEDYEKQCHMFFYTRNISGTPVTYTEFNNPAIPDVEGNNHVSVFEHIIICVDDEGVAQIDWRGNGEIIGYESEDSQLLPFEKIMEIAKQQFMDQYTCTEDAVACELLISRVTLGYTTILQKNNNLYNHMVPVWDFFGTVSHNGIWEKEEPGYDSLLTIHAITGRVIDRNVGY